MYIFDKVEYGKSDIKRIKSINNLTNRANIFFINNPTKGINDKIIAKTYIY